MAFKIHPLFLLDAFSLSDFSADLAHFANHTAQTKCNAKLTLFFNGHFIPGITTLKEIKLGSEVLVHYSPLFNQLFEILPSADTISISSDDDDFQLQ